MINEKEKLLNKILDELEKIKEDYNECYDVAETKEARTKNKQIDKCKDVVKKCFVE